MFKSKGPCKNYYHTTHAHAHTHPKSGTFKTLRLCLYHGSESLSLRVLTLLSLCSNQNATFLYTLNRCQFCWLETVLFTQFHEKFYESKHRRNIEFEMVGCTVQCTRCTCLNSMQNRVWKVYMRTLEFSTWFKMKSDYKLQPATSGLDTCVVITKHKSLVLPIAILFQVYLYLVPVLNEVEN